MKTTKILIKSAEIPDERTKELGNADFTKKPPTAEEKKIYIKKAATMLLLSLGVAFFGVLVFFIRRRIIATGILIMAIIVLISALLEFLKLFKDMRKTDAKSAINAFLRVVLLGDDSAVPNKKSVLYAYDSMYRMVPEKVYFNKIDFYKYIENFRELLKDNINKGYDDVFLKDLSGKESLLYNLECVKFDEVNANGAVNCNCTFNLSYYEVERKKQQSGKLSTGGKTVNKIYARFQIFFDVMLIRTDKYIFLADSMPEFSVITGGGGEAPAGSAARFVNTNFI
jgi:hypothetical protein